MHNHEIESKYETLVKLLDGLRPTEGHRLIDQVGEDESHPLASMMDVIGVLIENYETEHVPELV
jgi:HTH-type transcriptional regulator / antitoxin HigA